MRLRRNSPFAIFIAGIAVLISGTLFAAEISTPKYFFEKKPYIHPKIIEDLSTWLSDGGEQVVAINLLESMGTNRYFGDIKTGGKEPPFIYYEKTEECEQNKCPMGPPFFGYRFIGKSASGIYVLLTESSGGGSGRFRNILLASLEKDRGLSYDEKKHTLRRDRERWIIRKLAEIPLGDRYDGEISVKGNVLHIGKDRYSHSSGLYKEDTEIKIESVR